MFLKYYNIVINNNIWLSLFMGVLATLIFYLENKRTKTIYNNMDYIKLLCIVASSIYFVLYIKNKEIKIKESNIKLGDPDF